MNPITKSDCVVRFDRSSGPGGQNVNKVNSKAVIAFDVLNTLCLTEEEKLLVLEKSKRLTKDGRIVIHCQQFRDQHKNLNSALEILNDHVADCLNVAKPRETAKPKKVAEKSEAERIEDKRHRGERKAARRTKNLTRDWSKAA